MKLISQNQTVLINNTIPNDCAQESVRPKPANHDTRHAIKKYSLDKMKKEGSLSALARFTLVSSATTTRDPTERILTPDPLF